MISRHAVPLASLAWSFGVIALVLQATPKIDQSAKAPLPPGDESPPIMLAVKYLMHTDRFYAASVGYAGLTPPQVLAWQVVLHDPHAVQIFKTLSGDLSTNAGRLYGLAGLYVVDRDEYRVMATELRRWGGIVSTMQGCIVSDRSAADIIAEMDQGEWSREFLAGRGLPGR